MRTLLCASLLAALTAAPPAAEAQAAQATPQTAVTQDEIVLHGDTTPRPATPTFYGDTVLWFVPTAETMPNGKFSFSVFRANFDRRQGLTDVNQIGFTAAVGLGKPVEPLRSPLVEANTLTAALSAASAELQLRHEHSEFLMRELAHRSKNQLAVVKGMALQTARQSGTVEQFVEQFGQRIQGLAESQDLMLRQNWQGAWLSDLVRAHLDLFGAVDDVMVGEDVTIGVDDHA